MTDCSNNKNTLKVHLKNFQSISNAELEFKQGLNIIVGESNSGKSAIFRAIKGAILNPSGSQKYIKNKQKEFEVTLDYNGNNILWQRSTKSPKYTINGETYDKIGNSNLLDFINNSGFVLDENKNLMNIESELDLPFPFDKSNAELFKLFEKSIFCISDSSAIVKLIKADEENTLSLRDNAQIELDRYKNKLNAIEELESEVDLGMLLKNRDCIQSILKNRETLLLDINKLNDIISIGKVLSGQIPKIIVKLGLGDSYLLLVQDIQKLQNIKLAGLILSKQVSQINDVIDISKYSSLQNDILQLEKLNNIIKVLAPIKELNKFSLDKKYLDLRKDVMSLLQIQNTISSYQEQINNIKVDIDCLFKEKNEYKICPLCGGEIK